MPLLMACVRLSLFLSLCQCFLLRSRREPYVESTDNMEMLSDLPVEDLRLLEDFAINLHCKPMSKLECKEAAELQLEDGDINDFMSSLSQMDRELMHDLIEYLACRDSGAGDCLPHFSLP